MPEKLSPETLQQLPASDSSHCKEIFKRSFSLFLPFLWRKSPDLEKDPPLTGSLLLIVQVPCNLVPVFVPKYSFIPVEVTL
jgi:hypothetical protein